MLRFLWPKSSPRHRAQSARAQAARLFISSTFVDMQRERDILSRLVLPRIRERADGVELQEIDLRWGVTEAMARDGAAVRICLDELFDCWPFVIGMVGRRVGWRPPLEVLSRSHADFARTLPNGVGMTEIELRYALHLGSQASNWRPLVFLRSDRLSMGAGGQDASDEEIAVLRQWISKSSAVEAVSYDSHDAFESLAEEKLRSRLDALLKNGATRRQVRPSRPTIDRSRDLTDLDRIVGEQRPTLIFAPRGAGSTWLLKSWLGHDERSLYLDGRSPSSTRLGPSPRFGTGQRQALGVDLSDNRAATYLPQWMMELLHEVHERRPRRIVIDHFESFFATEAHADLSAVPTRLPHCACAIVTHSSRLRDQAQRLGWARYELRPVSREQGSRFAQDYLQSYSKVLTQDQATTLFNTTWGRDLSTLVLVLDELRRFGSFEKLSERITALSGCETGADVVEEIVAGLRGVLPDIWSGAADDVLLALGLSLRGLDEGEACAIAGLARASKEAMPQHAVLPPHLWSTIRISLGAVLARRGNLIDVDASGPTDWIARKLARHGDEVRRVIRAMDTHFSERAGRRRYEEAPRLAELDGGEAGLERLLSDPSMLRGLISVGETFAEGVAQRLSAAARQRATDAWRRMAVQGEIGLDDTWQLGLLAARIGERESAQKLLSRGSTTSAASEMSSPTLSLERDIGLALLTRDEVALRCAYVAFAALRRTGEANSSIQMLTLALLAALARGDLRLAANEETALARDALTAGEGNPLFEGQAHLYLGQIYVHRARWKDASDAFELAQRAGRALGHAQMLCQALERESAVAIERSKFSVARKAAAECRELSLRAGLNELEALAFERLIEIERRRANWSDAYTLAEAYMGRCKNGIADVARAKRALDSLEN